MRNVFQMGQVIWDKIALLQSREGYKEWYLECHGECHGECLVMFSQDCIGGLIEDVEPNYYPCYALPQRGKYEVIYLDPDLFFYFKELSALNSCSW